MEIWSVVLDIVEELSWVWWVWTHHCQCSLVSAPVSGQYTWFRHVNSLTVLQQQPNTVKDNTQDSAATPLTLADTLATKSSLSVVVIIDKLYTEKGKRCCKWLVLCECGCSSWLLTNESAAFDHVTAAGPMRGRVIVLLAPRSDRRRTVRRRPYIATLTSHSTGEFWTEHTADNHSSHHTFHQNVIETKFHSKSSDIKNLQSKPWQTCPHCSYLKRFRDYQTPWISGQRMTWTKIGLCMMMKAWTQETLDHQRRRATTTTTTTTHSAG